MPYKDILEVKTVWKDTVQKIKEGKRNTYFPKKSEHRVSHVRPHARNANDTETLPVPDTLTGATTYTKHCFWLNAKYIKNEIYLK